MPGFRPPRCQVQCDAAATLRSFCFQVVVGVTASGSSLPPLRYASNDRDSSGLKAPHSAPSTAQSLVWRKKLQSRCASRDCLASFRLIRSWRGFQVFEGIALVIGLKVERQFQQSCLQPKHLGNHSQRRLWIRLKWMKPADLPHHHGVSTHCSRSRCEHAGPHQCPVWTGVVMGGGPPSPKHLRLCLSAGLQPF